MAEPTNSGVPSSPTKRSFDLSPVSGDGINILDETMKLKKTVGLWGGVSLIVGTMIGSGIFVSPKGVLMETGSFGMSLVVWAVCGVICLIGSLCFAELGCCISKSGGMYAYIHTAFGDLCGFLYLWTAMLIIFPAANAVIALTCAYYVLQPIFPTCAAPDPAIRLIAAAAIVVLTVLNCYSVVWATRVQSIFTVIKTLCLILIILTGIVVLCRGDVSNFQQLFEGTFSDPGKISLAFYSGLFSYSGWYTLNFLTEEIVNPYVNIPRAIWVSMPITTVIYVMTNVAYFAVLNQQQILDSDAVAVTFADKLYGVMSWIMPVCVACSTFGSLNGCILSVSRMFYVGSRDGFLPQIVSTINFQFFTPIPAVVIEGLISVAMLITSDVYLLINYVTFIEFLGFFCCILGLMVMRFTKRDLKRPIKVSWVLPILFTIVSIYLLVFPVITLPVETGIGLAIMFSGIPVYIVAIKWKNKPKSISAFVRNMTVFCQKIFNLVPEDKID